MAFLDFESAPAAFFQKANCKRKASEREKEASLLAASEIIYLKSIKLSTPALCIFMTLVI